MREPRLQAIRARRQFRQVEGTRFVRIEQAGQTPLLRGHDLRGSVALSTTFDLYAVALGAAHPLIQDARGIFERRPHGVPDVSVQRVHAHLRVVADAAAREAVGVAAHASIVGVAGAPLARGRRDGLAVVGVAAARADHESLQQVAVTPRVARREPLVAFELLARRGEDLGRHECRDGDRDPLLGGAGAGRAPGTSRRAGLAADGSQQLAAGHRLRLAVGRLACVRRVAQDAPDCRAVPARRAPSRRDARRVEVAHELSDRLLAMDEGVEQAAHDLRFGEHNLVTRRLRGGARDVAVAVGRARQGIDQTLPRAMELAATVALHQPCALVLRDHPLDLREQGLLGRLPARAEQEHDPHPSGRELLEQQHLIGVAASETVGAVDVDQVDRALRDPIAQPLQARSHERRAAEPVVKVEVVGRHPMTVGGSTLLEGRDLAVDRGALGLLRRRYPCVQGDGDHLADSFLRTCAGVGITGSGAADRTSRRVIGTRHSYAWRRCSAASRVGSYATRIRSGRSMRSAWYPGSDPSSTRALRPATPGSRVPPSAIPLARAQRSPSVTVQGVARSSLLV